MAAERHGHTYLTLDDENVLQAAREDPVGFCKNLPKKVILDEIQRIPELFTSIKAAVDRDRQSGRIILTGSANVMLLPKLSDSLAGRMEVIRLSPLAQVEIENIAPGKGFLDALFESCFSFSSVPQEDVLLERVIRGGFPAALRRATSQRRREWQTQYIDALTQRDLRDLSRIRSLQTVPKLLELAAGQTARLFNVSELASPFEISRPTIQEYLALLESIFLIEVLPPWHNNRLSRLIKTPKLHLADTGLAAALLGVDSSALNQDRALYGQLLETFVYQEIRRQSTWSEYNHRFYHYRDKDQMEVDVVIERAGTSICGVEVKASSTVRANDFNGLKRLKEATGSRFRCGIVLYDGEDTLPFGDQLSAVPINALWRI